MLESYSKPARILILLLLLAGLCQAEMRDIHSEIPGLDPTEEASVQKAKSYRVENILKIMVHDDKEFQATAHLVDAFAEVQYQGIDFEHSDKQAWKIKALAQALANSAERAKLYEDRLQVRLVPKGFAEAEAMSQGAPPSLPQQLESKSLLGRSPKAPTPIPGRNDFASVAEESGSLFGELYFSARVSVDYAVEPK